MYRSLQAGRAFAAVGVMLFHLGGAIAAAKYFNLPAFAVPFSFGDSGVEFFFVLSGFIILTAHRSDISRPSRIGPYLGRRLVRVYPTYWILFLATCLLASFSAALRGVLPHDASVFLKSLLLVPQDKAVVGGTGAPVLIVAWTLQYEMLFYAFFVLVLLNRFAAATVGAAWVALWLWERGSHSHPFPSSFLFADYVALFGFGMAVSAAVGARWARRLNPMAVLLLGLGLFGWVAVDKVLMIHNLAAVRTLLYGAASALIIFGLVGTESRGRIIGGHRSLQVLGDSSYALYLIHFPLISLLCKLAKAARLDALGVPGALAAFAGIAVACLAVSVCFHLWIEKPLIASARAAMARRADS